MASKDTPSNAKRAQLFKGITELALLFLLRERPHYGLDALQRIQNDLGLPIAEGTIYPLLHRLEKSGLIESEWKISDGRTRPRRYYTITRKGEEALKERRDDWREIRERLDRLLDD